MMDVYNLTINYRTLRKREVFCFIPQKKHKRNVAGTLANQKIAKERCKIYH